MNNVISSANLDFDEVQAEVSRILASADFAASEQLSAFLKFVVDESLAGRGELLKERTIALKALDRDPDFDPRLDSAVRVVAGKLRRALSHFYALEGAANPLRIEIPKGQYQPVFLVPGEQATIEEKAASTVTLEPHLTLKALTRSPQAIGGYAIIGLGVLMVLLLGIAGAIFLSDRLSEQHQAVARPQIVEQAGALPYRLRDGVVEVLLVRTSRDSHWTIPKATHDPGIAMSQTAANEAFKEAGVHGTARQVPIGDYLYDRRSKRYHVTVYSVLVSEELSSWPEMSRRRTWCDTQAAGDLVASTDLGAVIRSFEPEP